VFISKRRANLESTKNAGFKGLFARRGMEVHVEISAGG
jgi:hypothetical protein